MRPCHEPQQLFPCAALSIRLLVCPGHQLLTKQTAAKLFHNVLNTRSRPQAVPGHASQPTPDQKAAKNRHGCPRLLNLMLLRHHPTAPRPVNAHSRNLCAQSLRLRRLRHQKTIGTTLVLAIPPACRPRQPINTPITRHLPLNPPSVSFQPNNANRSLLCRRTSAITNLARAQSDQAER